MRSFCLLKNLPNWVNNNFLVDMPNDNRFLTLKINRESSKVLYKMGAVKYFKMLTGKLLLQYFFC